MLYIQNYTKFDLDKSSESMYRYYISQFAELNDNIDGIRAYLENMLVEIGDLRVDLQETKNTIQESLDRTEDAYSKAGLTNPALATVQNILDKAEEDLDNLEENIGTTIDSIDCEEATGCTFVGDCAEVGDCMENSDTPIETPAADNCDYDWQNDCQYCAYGYCEVTAEECGNSALWDCQEGGCHYTNGGDCNEMACQVCAFDSTCNESCINFINMDCMEESTTGIPGELNPVTHGDDPCEYYSESRLDCENPDGCDYAVDGNSGAVSCSAGFDFEDKCDYYDGHCYFSCDVTTECGQLVIPSSCDYTDFSSNPCNYDTSSCTYEDKYTGESSCPGNDDLNCPFSEQSCDYEEASGCRYDSASGFDSDCFNYLTPEEANCNNYCNYNEDCGEGGCEYDPRTDGVDCEGGDSYDPSCDNFGDDDDDDDSNVICTYIIERLFKSDVREYYKQISRENIVLGFKGGLNKKILKEYKYGLGPIIIDQLRHENNLYMNYLWNTRVIPIWIELRRSPKVGYKKYIQFVIEMIDRYNIHIFNFPTLNNLYYEER